MDGGASRRNERLMKMETVWSTLHIVLHGPPDILHLTRVSTEVCRDYRAEPQAAVAVDVMANDVQLSIAVAWSYPNTCVSVFHLRRWDPFIRRGTHYTLSSGVLRSCRAEGGWDFGKRPVAAVLHCPCPWYGLSSHSLLSNSALLSDLKMQGSAHSST
jgi:hypothetical protein